MSRKSDYAEQKVKTGSSSISYTKQKIIRGFNRLIVTDVAAKILKTKLAERNAKNCPGSIKELFDLLSTVNDEITYPTHLKQYLDHLEAIVKGEQRNIVFAAPPGHGKSFCSLMALVFLCITSQSKTQNAYVSYSTDQAKYQLRVFTGILDQLGVSYTTSGRFVHVAPFNNDKQINTIYWAGADAGLTGKHFDTLVIADDLIKDITVANSTIQKETIWQNFWTSIKTRKKPGKHLSIVVMATRWVTDDLSGRLIKQKWPYINLKAICDNEQTDPNNRKKGEVLAPHIMSLEQLLEMKETNPLKFEALYNGTPISENYQIFQGYSTYESIPLQGQFIFAAGIDLAYSTNIKSDYCSIIIVKYDIKNDIFYLVDSYMVQKLYTDFIEDIKLFKQKYNLAHIRFDAGALEAYTAGTYLINKIPEVKIHRAAAGMGKIQRSARTAELWNNGRILVPQELAQTPIMAKTIATIQLFDGDGRKKDDCVDALSSAINCIADIISNNQYNKALQASNSTQKVGRYTNIGKSAVPTNNKIIKV